MSSPIVERILRGAGNPEILKVLSEGISLTDLQSLLLEVYHRRVTRLTAADVLRQYRQNRFVQPVAVSFKNLLELDLLALSLLPDDFEVLELSPLAPLGANSVFARVNQKNIVTTIRNTEVCADSTNVLALECAARRKRILSEDSGSIRPVKLFTSQRLVRGQFFREGDSFAHFRILGLCSAGRDQGSFRFESESLQQQVEFCLKFFHEALKRGYRISDIRVVFTALDAIRIPVLENLMSDLVSLFPAIFFQLKTEQAGKKGYYQSARFQIFVSDLQRQEVLIVDGGFTDWTARLLNNRKERLLIGGMGTERLVFCFRNPAAGSQ